MTNESDSPLPLPVSCTVSRLIRAFFDWDQQTVAGALKMDRKALSARERYTKGVAISRSEIERYVRALNGPVGVVEETYAFVLRVSGFPLPQAKGLVSSLRAMSDRMGAALSQQFFETSFAYNYRMLAETQRKIAESLWRHLSALPKENRRKAVESEPMYRTWGFAERLWRQSLNAAADDAVRALDLGEMALGVAQSCGGDGEDPRFGSRIQGLALSAVANAKRVRSQLLAADQDLARAKELWEAGAAADPGILDEARFLALESALRVDQRRFPEALACIDAAFRAARPDADVVYLFISKGNILLDLQLHEKAAEVYLEATARMGPSTSLRDRWLARFNLTACLVALGRPTEAEGRLPELRSMAISLGNGLDLLRVRWLEGQTQAGLLQRERAIATFGEVRDAFLARGTLYGAALVSLERAALQLEAGETEEVRREAPELAEAFRDLGVAPELLASVSLFWAAAGAEKATAEQARLILGQLRQAEAAPA